jgi:hypothetical protein
MSARQWDANQLSLLLQQQKKTQIHKIAKTCNMNCLLTADDRAIIVTPRVT